jgi:hypothetical protein
MFCTQSQEKILAMSIYCVAVDVDRGLIQTSRILPSNFEEGN